MDAPRIESLLPPRPRPACRLGAVELSGHTDDHAIESTWDFTRP
jgi:hypothetical protein